MKEMSINALYAKDLSPGILFSLIHHSAMKTRLLISIVRCNTGFEILSFHHEQGLRKFYLEDNDEVYIRKFQH